ncbi:hypothetical protein BDZ94DRAFT_1249914 [Collybia nuda]|uniref:Uncharacterized protein n=1 Tax=Collybia nuda TaxID=64659 RepID=A0A9P5YBV4_9AGAR|nr:hypothetical protein BDZ94DRAFT_1249914 [Collybia nuda]
MVNLALPVYVLDHSSPYRIVLPLEGGKEVLTNVSWGAVTDARVLCACILCSNPNNTTLPHMSKTRCSIKDFDLGEVGQHYVWQILVLYFSALFVRKIDVLHL